MIENHPQEALLIRFADGHTTPAEAEEARALVQADPAAAQFMHQLEVTKGWLDQAAALPLESASDKATALVRDFEPEKNQITALTPKKPKANLLALAATLVVGVAGGWLLGTNVDTNPAGAPIQNVDASPPEWVRLVADYHALYARETISGASSQRTEAVSAELSERLNRKISVPVLDALGLEFKRVQTLEFDNQTLLQLAYLPESDRPIAICILAAGDMGSANIASGTHGAMKYAYWQNQQHAVVVVGEIPDSQLNEVVNEVRQSLFPVS